MSRSKSPEASGRTLPENFNRHVNAYSVAALAAGVSIMALAQPAEGKVVITNKTIPVDGTVFLDLNNDGVADLEFSFFKTYAHYTGLAALDVFPTEKGGGFVANGSYASALLRSAKIGPSAHFSGAVNKSSIVGVFMEGNSCLYSKCESDGNWGGNHPNRFLGVRFTINGKIHYGWVRVTVTITTQNILSATITEYGYETIANKRLLAGVPSNQAEVSPANAGVSASKGPSLGILAAGAEGLPIWRREDTTVHP